MKRSIYCSDIASRIVSHFSPNLADRSGELQEQEVSILGIPISNLTMQELLGKLTHGIVFTPNVDHLMKLRQNPEFREAYLAADYRTCDSKIVLKAAQFLGKPLKGKVSGSDLFPAFCKHHKYNGEVKIFLLGGSSKAATQAAHDNINRKTGRHIVTASYCPPFGFETDEAECQRIVDAINRSGANVLAVGVGAPKQELWIVKYRDRLPNIKIFMAVGATINFEAGLQKRSPAWISELGLEWLHRLLSEPRRLWKRYLIDDLPFLWLILKQKFSQ